MGNVMGQAGLCCVREAHPHEKEVKARMNPTDPLTAMSPTPPVPRREAKPQRLSEAAAAKPLSSSSSSAAQTQGTDQVFTAAPVVAQPPQFAAAAAAEVEEREVSQQRQIMQAQNEVLELQRHIEVLTSQLEEVGQGNGSSNVPDRRGQFAIEEEAQWKNTSEAGTCTSSIGDETEKMHVLANCLVNELNKMRQDKTKLKADVHRLESEMATLRLDMEHRDMDVVECHYRGLEAHKAGMRRVRAETNKREREQANSLGSSEYVTPRSSPRSGKNSLGGTDVASLNGAAYEPRFSVGSAGAFAGCTPMDSKDGGLECPESEVPDPNKPEELKFKPTDTSQTQWLRIGSAAAGLSCSPSPTVSQASTPRHGGQGQPSRGSRSRKTSDIPTAAEEETLRLLENLPSPCKAKLKRLSSTTLSTPACEGKTSASFSEFSVADLHQRDRTSGASVQSFPAESFFLGTPARPDPSAEGDMVASSTKAPREMTAEGVTA